MPHKMLALVIILCFSMTVVGVSYPNVTENIRHSSIQLGYDVQYRVFLPSDYQKLKDLPTIYFTDGPSFLYSGRVAETLIDLIKDKKIRPVIAIFIDSRDPQDLSINRRNAEFFCNAKYSDFVTQELVPLIDKNYPTSQRAKDRIIMGLSFGALNSACFGAMANNTFEGIGMLSPALHPVEKIYDFYNDNKKLPLNFYISTGTINDNYEKTNKFKRILKSKGYLVKYKVVKKGRHNWKNWKPLVDNFLVYFFEIKN